MGRKFPPAKAAEAIAEGFKKVTSATEAVEDRA
jgi:hypothetical protein